MNTYGHSFVYPKKRGEKQLILKRQKSFTMFTVESCGTIGAFNRERARRWNIAWTARSMPTS